MKKIDYCTRCHRDLNKYSFDGGCICCTEHNTSYVRITTNRVIEHGYDGYGSFDYVEYLLGR